jgi:hypothetical protein
MFNLVPDAIIAIRFRVLFLVFGTVFWRSVHMKNALRFMLVTGLVAWVGCQSATDSPRSDAGGAAEATSEFTLVSLKVPNMH